MRVYDVWRINQALRLLTFYYALEWNILHKIHAGNLQPSTHPPTHLCIHTSRQKCYEIKIVACEKRHCSDGIGHFLLISWIYEIRVMDRPTKLNIYIVQRKEGNGRHTQRDREWERTVFGKRRAQLKLDNDLKRAKQNWTMRTEHNRNIFNIDKTSFMKCVCVFYSFHSNIRSLYLSLTNRKHGLCLHKMKWKQFNGSQITAVKTQSENGIIKVWKLRKRGNDFWRTFENVLKFELIWSQ